MLRRETISTTPGRLAKHMPARVRSAAQRLTTTDRRILGLWAGAHLALAVIAWMTSWINSTRSIYTALLGTYDQWDAGWYQTIGAHGYFSGQSRAPDAYVFLPGEPAVLALAHLLVRDWAAAEWLTALIAGGVALVCLGRLGGEKAGLYLLTAPAAMYLMVGYSESLFLALALPAWMAARRRDWQVAALLAAFAGAVRVDGLFLIAGLLVMALTGPRGRRLRSAAWMSLALAGPASYEMYLRIGSGSWTAWLTGNEAWGLHYVGPWQSLKGTWGMAFGPGLKPAAAAMFQLEIACMAVAVALTLWLLWRRQWPEAVYCGLAVAALGTTAYYQSVPRALLVMWPLYIILARAAARRPWVGQVYLWVSAPLAVITAVYFFLGVWAV